MPCYVYRPQPRHLPSTLADRAGWSSSDSADPVTVKGSMIIQLMQKLFLVHVLSAYTHIPSETVPCTTSTNASLKHDCVLVMQPQCTRHISLPVSSFLRSLQCFPNPISSIAFKRTAHVESLCLPPLHFSKPSWTASISLFSKWP